MEKLWKRTIKDRLASVFAWSLFCLLLMHLMGLAHADDSRKNVRQNLPEVNDPVNGRVATKGTANEDAFTRGEEHGQAYDLDDREYPNEDEALTIGSEGDSGGLPSFEYHVQFPARSNGLKN